MSILTNSFIGIIFIVVGTVFKLVPPKHTNSIYGYRSPFSTKNKEVWEEGNRFSAIMMIVGGTIAVLFSTIVTIIYKNRINMSKSISNLFSMIIALGLVLYTEVHLRKIFDKDGNRK
ncbi:SdpI family protein [Clostridium sp. MB40-C1]|uniref:SdpI family protein n=1 Tax=Clostridium sp. MB40-C1 TaxID=3070996 RepID=UPI0027DFB7FE|nr:SdpI family protein [Clostridium sp. MB40-C1]WMJ81152.1 SdpI family protein [Clostridium sp. MB40-C1]